MTDGVQIIPASGPFPGLASSYDAQWIGPWLGAEALIEAERGWSIMANFEYHLADYSASANWNLRTDLAHRSVSDTPPQVQLRHVSGRIVSG